MTGSEICNRGNMDLKSCSLRAAELITANGICLFLFDMIDSKKDFAGNLHRQLGKLTISLNQVFADYLPENDLAVSGRIEKGFMHILGDASWAGINHYEVIGLVNEYTQENYPEIKLRYSVAENGYDRQGIRLVR